MSVTIKDFWTIVHGMGLGSIFLIAFAGGLAGLWSLRAEFVTAEGIKERLRRLTWGTMLMTIASWLTVISGTWFVYIWYRAKPPEGTTDLIAYPRSFLLKSAETAAWHSFGMEWKEHVAWIAPILATAVSYVVFKYGKQLVNEEQIRKALITLFVLAFFAAAVAGMFGAFINKVAPTR